MPFPDIDPVLIQLGPFAIRWYALAYVAGILIGWRYITALVKNQALWPLRGPPVSVAQIDDLILWITLGIIVGGRLGHVLFYTPAMIVEAPLEVFKTWKGGMSFHGGTLGVLVATLLFARVNKVDVFRLGDVITAAAPIGLFFGRIANFINGELWGRPTDVPWAVVFPDAGIMPRHPSQIYEALLEGLVLFIVLRIATHRAKLLNRRGVVAGLFFLGYAICRIALENVREPDVGMPDFPFGLTMGMMLSIPMALGGAWLIWRGMGEPLPEPEIGLEAQVEEVVEGEPPERDPFKIEADGPA
ncbi:prolipoprotein diacylglyceryl transferase [Phenylobacterium sp. 20VBR1]|uniref:Phosphatidylglycerol--prolipoprotein diacylglyceryl transferase n=1 Tax=Phenylobacterium glaciei TaxID=2803784 RepID=A0A941HXG9_9CAUL|nr:prolipoprotein diacylglyceryl transferase [Phenylobacterium glaciei]